MAHRAPSIAEQLFIVPAAHTRLSDTSFQTEMYALFHRTRAARIGHNIGTLSILVGALVLASRAPGVAAPAIAVVLVLDLTRRGMAVDRVVGVATALVAMALVAAAFAIARALGPAAALPVALACIFGGCAVQTLSHSFEEVPPPLSGTAGWLPLRVWRRRIGIRDAARAAALTVGVFFWLEMWAALRILPLQILHLSMLAGHRPDLRRALDARIAAILAAPTSDWRLPEEPARDDVRRRWAR
jgi:hypothetical protein